MVKKHSKNPISVSISVRTDTGEPIFAVLQTYRSLIRKTGAIGWFNRQTDRVLHHLKHGGNNWIEFNQIQIFNAGLSSLDVELTKVANKLIDGAHFSHGENSFPIFIESDLNFCLSPECKRALYLKTPQRGYKSYVGLLLDLCRETCRKLEIDFTTEVKWSEDSRLLGLSFYSSEPINYNGIQSKYWTRLFDCENENADVNCHLPGSLLALRWVDHNNYSACVNIKDTINYYLPVIQIYNVSIGPTGIITTSLSFQVELKFTENIHVNHISSMCFDRFRERYFVILNGNHRFEKKYAFSFQQSEFHSPRLISSTSDQQHLIPLIHLDADHRTNAGRLSNEIIGGPLNPSSPLIACFPYIRFCCCHYDPLSNPIVPRLRSLENLNSATTETDRVTDDSNSFRDGEYLALDDYRYNTNKRSSIYERSQLRRPLPPRRSLPRTAETSTSAASDEADIREGNHDLQAHTRRGTRRQKRNSSSEAFGRGGEGTVATLFELAWRTLYSGRGALALECAIRQKRVPPTLLTTCLRWNPYTLGPLPSTWLQ